MIINLLCLILLLSIDLSFSQEQTPPDQDRVIFKNHSQLDGEIIEVSKKWVVIKSGNAPFTINKNKIAAIYYQGGVISFLDINNVKSIKDGREGELEDIIGYSLIPIKEPAKRGFYNITYGANYFADSSFGFESIIANGGSGVENISGFQLSQYSGFGLGIGYHSSGNSRDGALVPIFVEYRGYFNNWKVSPYYAIAFGGAFGSKKENTNYDSSKPGTYFYPSIGFKSGSNVAAFMVDLGVRFASITTYTDFNFETREEKESYKGVVLRIGIMF